MVEQAIQDPDDKPGRRKLAAALKEVQRLRQEEERHRERHSPREDAFRRHIGLTSREFDVAMAWRSGVVAAKEIARLLGLSGRTVEIHTLRIKTKLRAAGKPQAVLNFERARREFFGDEAALAIVYAAPQAHGWALSSNALPVEALNGVYADLGRLVQAAADVARAKHPAGGGELVIRIQLEAVDA
jgi:DNA-binding CsgD family transcriptional regulator